MRSPTNGAIHEQFHDHILGDTVGAFASMRNPLRLRVIKIV